MRKVSVTLSFVNLDDLFFIHNAIECMNGRSQKMQYLLILLASQALPKTRKLKPNS